MNSLIIHVIYSSRRDTITLVFHNQRSRLRIIFLGLFHFVVYFGKIIRRWPLHSANVYILISRRCAGAAMTPQGNETFTENNIWLRGVFMILFGMLYSLAGTVLFVVAVLQFIFVLLGSAPNTRLLAFGRSLGSYVQQLVNFQTFNTEEKP